MVSCQVAKNRINLDLIEIIQFCVNIYDLLRICYRHIYPCVETSPPMGRCMGGKVGSCQIAKNRVNLDLIEII